MPEGSASHGGRREGAGRPALPDEERRTTKVQVRLTPAERDKLDAIKIREGLATRSAALTWLIQRHRGRRS